MADDSENGADGSPLIMDELEFEPVAHQTPRKSLSGAILLTVGLLIVTGGAGWYFLGDMFGQWSSEDNGAAVPFIRADETPIKVRPKDPGGMDVPNRDKLIYGRLRGAGDSPPLVERLMPSAESPLSVLKPESPLSVLKPESPLSVPKPESPLSVPKPESPLSVPKPETPLSVPKPEPSSPPLLKNNEPSANMTKSLEAAVSSLTAEQPATPSAGEVAATPPPVSPPPVTRPGTDKKSKPAKSEGFKIQVGAVRSTSGAKSEWQRLKRKNPKLLGNMKLFITKADLGVKKGIFYRLRAGPISDEAAARGLCKKLTKRKVGCLVVRPGE